MQSQLKDFYLNIASRAIAIPSIQKGIANE
jgi:hypothetical protein